MAQTPKFIDVTRTYMPCDPRSFMETLQIPGPSEAPESRTPVMAYYGSNFMPTAYGYKSYFGTNAELNIDDVPGRPDHVFIFQNQVFTNILMALCDNGIWMKEGDTGGPWTNLKSYTPPVDPAKHYEWSYTIIDNDFYCYLQGKDEYQKIEGILTFPGLTCTDVVPSFLNMEGQLGIFRAGGRLGFWDSENSVAWSNLDDYADMTPSLTTLAGNSIFKDVRGRIILCKEHGNGFMIYSTQSVVYVNPTPTQTYQWAPVQVINNAGIVYPRQVAVSVPDNEHYVWTTVGLYKITDARPELLVPQITDFIRKTPAPVYLRMMEGRHLFIENLDPEFMASKVNFSEGVVDPLIYEFPGTSGTLLEAVEETQLTGTSVCYALKNYGKYADQVTFPPDMKPGTNAEPRYMAYLSNNDVKDPANITWATAPCGPVNIDGVAQAMSPVGIGGRLDSLTTNSTNKTAVSGADAYIDGKWTIERFVQTQLMLWKLGDDVRDAVLEAIVNRAKYQEKVDSVGSCTGTARVRTECVQGDYVTKFGDIEFGFNKCQFWLTRYALEAATLKTVTHNQTQCVFVPTAYMDPTVTWSLFIRHQYCNQGWAIPAGGSQGAIVSSPFCVTPSDRVLEDYPPVSQGASCHYGAVPLTPGASYAWYSVYDVKDNTSIRYCGRNSLEMYEFTPINVCPSGWSLVARPNTSYLFATCAQAASYNRTRYFTSENKLFAKTIAKTPETAYCVLVGHDYTKNDNTPGFQAAAACSGPTIFEDKLKNQPLIAVGEDDGKFCSKPFDPVTIPGTPAVTYDWPTETLTIPGGSFILQDGSPAPVYPTIYGAYVYDTHLKKWGNIQTPYKLLIDYTPINSGGAGTISYANFGMKGGIVTTTGRIRLFDSYPVDSFIAYGKVGYYRLGMTSPEEVRVDFANQSTGTIIVKTSLDGRNLATELVTVQEFEDTNQVILTGAFPGRWADIIVEGIYDIQYMEYRGKLEGRR